MDLTAGSKTTAVTAAVVMVAGLSIILYGLIVDDLTRSLSGACLTLPAMLLLALVAIRSWTTDTSDERRVLAAANRATQAERTRYIAAQAALENERVSLQRALAQERAADAAKLRVEREAMFRDVEERRASIACEAIEATFMMIRNGEFAPEDAAKGNLIQFPSQPASAARERSRERSHERTQERSREHGIVGP